MKPIPREEALEKAMAINRPRSSVRAFHYRKIIAALAGQVLDPKQLCALRATCRLYNVVFTPELYREVCFYDERISGTQAKGRATSLLAGRKYLEHTRVLVITGQMLEKIFDVEFRGYYELDKFLVAGRFFARMPKLHTFVWKGDRVLPIGLLQAVAANCPQERTLDIPVPGLQDALSSAVNFRCFTHLTSLTLRNPHTIAPRWATRDCNGHRRDFPVFL